MTSGRNGASPGGGIKAGPDRHLERAGGPADEAAFDAGAADYDAVLIVSFGGPEGPDDVEPFLDNVLRGLPITPASRARIAERYQGFGGVSPINAETRALIAALRQALDAHGPALPIYWGNRNWHPLLPDTLQRMADDGVERAIAFVTSLFGSYSGCRRYREDLHDAVSRVDGAAPAIDKLRNGFNHPGFIEAMAERVAAALAGFSPGERAATPILFSAHSLPEGMARLAPYQAQLEEACRLVADALSHARWRLVYQSNNARYGGQEWLEPDVCDALADIRAQGGRNAVVAPIGFVCDHLEVVLDLDVEAAQAAERLGMRMVRAATVGTHPAFVGMIGELIGERMAANPTRRALGPLGPAHDRCPADCCLSARPGPVRPALGSVDAPAGGAPHTLR